MSGILTTLQELIAKALDPDNPDYRLPTVLVGARANLDDLLSLRLDPSGAGLDQWLDKFRKLTQDEVLRETLIIRVLQVTLPRAAESLALLGVISMDWDGDANPQVPRSFRINWDRLRGVTEDPGQQALNLLAQRVLGINDLKALQVLALLLISGPRELLRLEYRRKGFLALPAGQGVNLDDLVELVNSPVAVPLIPGTGNTEITLRRINEARPVGSASARIELNGPDTEQGITRGQPLDGLGVTLQVAAETLNALRLPLGGTGWVLTADASGSGTLTAGVTIDGAGIAPSAGLQTPDVRLRVLLARSREKNNDALLIGDSKGTHLAIRDASVGVTLFPSRAAGGSGSAFGYTLALDGLRFALGTDLLKSFTGGLSLPGALRFDSDIDLSFLQAVPGIQGSTPGGISLGVEIPKHLGFSIGGTGAGLWVDDMLVRIEVAIASKGVDFRVAMRFDTRAEIGPLAATISGVGAWLGRWQSGNAGVLPPTGIGLRLDAGPITGGGYFKTLAPGEYAGALSLKIFGIGAFAYGIYKELPGGVSSFVAVIGIRLPLPGIQVGFGFAISGFGGLVGINRRADLDKLRERLASGTAGDVLFTEDPTRNAPRILGELRELFPDERGVHVFGPTIQINWLQILKLDVGLFIELPGPSKIILAGSGRLVIGSEDFALVRIRLDFVGAIDMTASLVSFEGSLVDSQVLGIIKITGGVAFRLGFGSNSYFLYSVGGFHPAFQPRDLAIPQVARAGASVDLGLIWLTQQMYFAVTSQTVHFGSRTEAGVEIGPIKVHGWFEFNALIEMRPFHFVADIDVGMSASFEGVDFASIRVQGELAGPGPLVLRAEASVKVLFVKVSKSVTLTLDNTSPEARPTIDNLATHLSEEISRPANLRGEGEDPDVVFSATSPAQPQQSSQAPVIPVGAVIWEQKRVPLDRILHKAEGIQVDPPRSVTVSVAGATTTPETDVFSVASTTEATDATALSGPAFSEGQSGFRLDLAGVTAVAGKKVPHTDAINLMILPRRSRTRLDLTVLAAFGAGLCESLAERSTGAQIKTQNAVVQVTAEKWTTPGGAISYPADAFEASPGAARPVSTPQVNLTGVL